MSIFELFVRNRSIFKVFSIFKEIEHQTQYSLPLFHYSSPFFCPYLKKLSNKKIYNILDFFSRRICGNFCKSWKRVTIDWHKIDIKKKYHETISVLCDTSFPHIICYIKNPSLMQPHLALWIMDCLSNIKLKILILRFNQTICMTFSLIYNIYFICFHITEYVKIMS